MIRSTRNVDGILELQEAMMDPFLEPSVYILWSKLYSRLLCSQTVGEWIAPVVSQICAHLLWQSQETHTWTFYNTDDFVHMTLCFYTVDSHCNLFLRTLGVGAHMLMLPYPHGNLGPMQTLDLPKDTKLRNGKGMTQACPWLISKPVILTRIAEAWGKGQLIACWGRCIFYSSDLSI